MNYRDYRMEKRDRGWRRYAVAWTTWDNYHQWDVVHRRRFRTLKAATAWLERRTQLHERQRQKTWRPL